MSTGWIIGLALAVVAVVLVAGLLYVFHIENQAEHEETRKHIEGARKQISSSTDETHGKLNDLKRAVTDKWKSITRPGNRW